MRSEFLDLPITAHLSSVDHRGSVGEGLVELMRRHRSVARRESSGVARECKHTWWGVGAAQRGFRVIVADARAHDPDDAEVRRRCTNKTVAAGLGSLRAFKI